MIKKYKYRIIGEPQNGLLGYRADIMDEKEKIWLAFSYEKCGKQHLLFFNVIDVPSFNQEEHRAYCLSLENFLEEVGFSRYKEDRFTNIPYKWILNRATDIENIEEFIDISQDLVEALND